MTDPSRPEDLEALHVPTRRVIVLGSAGWALVLLVVLLVPALHEGDRSWWPWTCVTGLVLGALGYAYVARGRGNAADAE
ncbi:MAG TPA: DUF2530 domain-containing protein [Dermatophilaceae bacterium]|nr:DUF2530 domain-containing protein [Dermatophilaceae bacterium]